MAALISSLVTRNLEKNIRRFPHCVSRTKVKYTVGDQAYRSCLLGIGPSRASYCILLHSWERASICHGRLCQDKLFLRCSIHTTSFCLKVETVNCPNLAESLSEGDVSWVKEKGDSVASDEVVCEIETDKTAIPVPSPYAGVIEELLIPNGEKVTPGTPLFTINVGAGASVEKAVSKPTEESGQRAAPEPEKTTEEQKPSAAEGSAKKQDDVSGPIPPSMPKMPDVPKAPLKVSPKHSVKPRPASSGAPAASSQQISGSRSETRVKMNRMRLRIASRLKEAQNTCAMLTTFNEIDMTNVIEMRQQYKDVFQKRHGLKLGFMSAFVKASAFALEDQPIVNAVIDNNEIVYRDYVDISVAVATPKGLVVPVVRNVGGMNYLDIEKAINELGEKARDGALAIEDMDGGTFTISNGGVFGSMFGTPIINPPQSAILGMHAIFDRPMAINGKIEIRPMMYVALTYDHRLVDGREAVTFLKKIKSAVEDPRVMFMNL